MKDLPFYLPVLFVLTTGLTLWLFHLASNRSLKILVVLLGWLGLQAVIGLTGFYTNTQAMPPRFAFLVGPAVLVIISLFFTANGKRFLDNLKPEYLTLLHVVRIPVELTLFGLFVHKAVPELMTFEGRNLDIVSGLTAPFIFYFGFVKKKLNRNVLLIWNLVCLGLLFNIVISAILSAPTPFQKFGFEQPNIGVLYFPFIWLPGFIVPVVLVSHLAGLRQLFLNKMVSQPLGKLPDFKFK